MNMIALMGRPAQDPETRYTLNRTCVTDFTLAVNRRYKRDGQPEADFFRCTAFGKNAESIEKYVKKGTKIIVTGSIQNDNYEKDGVKHYQMKVIVDTWEFAESKAEAGEEKPKEEGGDGFMNIPTNIDEELPFA